jgi:hypothetical protein
MMFGKEFLHQVCLFATIFFPYSLPIEIKETSVRFHVFVFSKEERWFALLQKMEVRKYQRKRCKCIFIVIWVWFVIISSKKFCNDLNDTLPLLQWVWN